MEWIARTIQENVGGDLVPIIPSEDYPLEYDALVDYAKQEANQDGRPAFEDLGEDPTSYKTVFIGYPIWWYQMPMIMDTFFDTYDFSGVTIIPFNTHEGSSDGGTYGDISELEQVVGGSERIITSVKQFTCEDDIFFYVNKHEY